MLISISNSQEIVAHVKVHHYDPYGESVDMVEISQRDFRIRFTPEEAHTLGAILINLEFD
jgi:hypothetical protein